MKVGDKRDEGAGLRAFTRMPSLEAAAPYRQARPDRQTAQTCEILLQYRTLQTWFSEQEESHGQHP